jgi:hypothetical protein
VHGCHGMFFACVEIALVRKKNGFWVIFIENVIRVEFQNKFFKADGYKYAPYSFDKALKE